MTINVFIGVSPYAITLPLGHQRSPNEIRFGGVTTVTSADYTNFPTSALIYEHSPQAVRPTFDRSNDQ